MSHEMTRNGFCGRPDGHNGRHRSPESMKLNSDREVRRQKDNPEWARLRNRISYKRNAAKNIERTSLYRGQHPELALEYHRTGAHGITRLWRDTLYELQNKACAGCHRAWPNDNLQIDHDHGHCAKCAGGWSCGKSVRGLLCPSCNVRDVLAPLLFLNRV